MQIYVINLDRSKERLAALTASLHAQGLGFTRIKACDGSSFSDAQYDAFTQYDAAFAALVRRDAQDHGIKSFLEDRPPFRSYGLSRGELGCFLSHRLCLEKIANGADPYAVVLEDDALLSPQAGLFLKTAHWIDAGTDFVKLDNFPRPCLRGRLSKALTAGYGLYPLLTRHYATTGYIISKKTAQRLYSLTAFASLPIDVLYFDHYYGLAASLKIQQFYPAIITQKLEEKTSTIQDRVLAKKRPSGLVPLIKREVKRVFERHQIRARIRYLGQSRWGKVPFF